MTMFVGDGPFGTSPTGHFNFTYDAPQHVLYLEPSPRRVTAKVGGQTVARSDRALLLHETGLMPVYYFPREDLRSELFTDSDTSTTCPFKGEAAYLTFSQDGETREDLAWYYPDPIDGAPDLSGHVALAFGGVDEWWEEAERITVHPRDPYHRCDVIDSERHVVVRIAGTVVAESDRATMLFETGLPARFYMPEVDVRADHLVPTDTRTECPYKGITSRYYDIRVGDTVVEDAAWVYDHPKPEVTGIRGKVAFYNERVDLIVDGEAWERPVTKFS